MVSTFSRIFTQTIGNKPSSNISRHIPMINSIAISAGSYLSETNQLRAKKSLMAWFKGTGELCGFVNKVARDISTRYHFEPWNDKASGRNRVKAANKFALQVQLRHTMEAQIADALITGEGYGWIGKLTDDTIKKEIMKSITNRGLSYKAQSINIGPDEILKELKEISDLSNIDNIDEALLVPRKYRYLASSTVENIHDEYDFKSYNHVVGGKNVIFKPEEVIHYTFMERDGKPNGFTPIISILTQLELLRFMWQNMMSIHRNGGTMDKIISYKDVQPNSPAFQKVKEEFMKYKNVENRHGLYLTTGDPIVHDLATIDAMQFKDMGLYITGLVALQWGISKSAIPYILGDTNSKADTGGEAERSYWEVVRDFQKKFADKMNSQLWIPYFGVKIVFENGFVHRDIQKETYKMQKLDNLLKEDNIWKGIGKKLNDKVFKRELLRDDDDLIEWEPEDDPMLQYQSSLTNQLPKNPKTDDQQNESSAKKRDQESTQGRRGKPTGFGKEGEDRIIRPAYKEMDTDAELSYKEIIGMDAMQVDIPTFIKLYNEDKAHDIGGMLRIFMRQNDMFTTLIYKSTDFVYKTIIRNEELEDGKISLMNLSGNIYRL